MKQLLLVEDDLGIAKSLTTSLRLQGFGVELAGTLDAARKLIERIEFDLVLLDVNLPDGSGFDLCKEIREVHSGLPILMLTARTDEASVVRGLGEGADDYVRKPVGSHELSARIQRLLRHQQGKLVFSGLELDLDRREIRFEKNSASLSPRELSVLKELMRQPGQVVPREKLLDVLDPEGEMEASTLDSHLSHVRSKVKKLTAGKIRLTASYGVGYRIEAA